MSHRCVFRVTPVACFLGSLCLAFLIRSEQTQADDLYAIAREQLVRDRIATAGVTDERVLDAIRATERHEFVPRSQRERAYLDMSLPIGESQTISSPFIVAMMTQAIEPKSTDIVLEIGTGSGYQAAVLSPLVKQVYSIEIVKELGDRAAETLKRLDYKNISTRVGDGFLGWEEAAPFDKIIVTCSPESVPLPLVEQLREGGVMIIPVGERYQQTLYLMTKQEGKLVRKALRPTLFVPMTGEAEQGRQVHPDAANPVVVNGDFETLPGDEEVAVNDFVPGWYYGRQVKHVRADSNDSKDTASGKAFVRFENETPGLSSHLLQGIPIDGKQVSMIRLSGRVRTDGVQIGPDPESLPMIAISLYDEQRRDLGTYWLGPFRGTRSWKEVSRLVRIPGQTREAILRLGLFGATGLAEFDEIVIKKVD
ncbi:protein-L-isoaspartate(D-aspartate) O-methyltransferase [Novipirellula artificiosorum]|uniref:Protein-L-isoaspartate O-methyltransferase n=1 Tax=Novipirellula artificiosorum TaxID=2528016 RepID=A0A5C6E2I8_9BACT|nr:protein-L-isoaspartate(D-aspartate) O-methyltransferase [Novipirellula artificiosorum]TWU42714.1 Protein-L-isoaspartate O-methyltransferase [Novipirellula artificiosorum]